jgi:hypothetical protein
MSVRRIVLCCFPLLGGTPLHAQNVLGGPQTAVLPRSITVGDVIHAAIRITVAPGTSVVFPDTLAVPADVEAAGRRIVRVDTAGGAVVHTAAWPLAVWRPDSVRLPPAEVRVSGPAGEEVVTASFPRFALESVLPADTTGIQPRPAKDVLGANRLWWPWLLLLALLALAAALAYWWYKRRKPAPVVAPIIAVSPRERALEQLDRARAAGLVEAGAMKEFYSLVSDALRHYIAALAPQWSPDLTTSELAGRMRGLTIDREAAELLGILGEADLVKFARRRPGAEDALRRWGTARSWVERFDWPPPLPEARAA